MPTTNPAAYGHLLRNAAYLYDRGSYWRPGKRATVALLRAAAGDPRVYAAVPATAAAMAQATAGDETDPDTPPPPPTLADLIRSAFDLVLLVYGPALPFKGYWVRAARDFVLLYLDQLMVPSGIVYRQP